uniref:Uncharacterized protein n=1 Tax=Anopheles coluzzii TaxID=1518534 RepID=A0A6E8W1I4_ANOCL
WSCPQQTILLVGGHCFALLVRATGKGDKKKTIAHQILLFPFELQHPITRRNDPYNERLGKTATMY